MAHDPKQLQAAMERAAPDLELTFRPMFGGIMAYSAGQVFASLSDVGLAFKLSGADHAELLGMTGAKRLQYDPNAPLSKSHVVVPDAMLVDGDNLRNWLGRSVAGVKSTKKRALKT